jgi:hypothetical protein
MGRRYIKSLQARIPASSASGNTAWGGMLIVWPAYQHPCDVSRGFRPFICSHVVSTNKCRFACWTLRHLKILSTGKLVVDQVVRDLAVLVRAIARAGRLGVKGSRVKGQGSRVKGQGSGSRVRSRGSRVWAGQFARSLIEKGQV